MGERSVGVFISEKGLKRVEIEKNIEIGHHVLCCVVLVSFCVSYGQRFCVWDRERMKEVGKRHVLTHHSAVFYFIHL